MYQTHFHRRNLPHFYRPNSTYFITYRLKGTIPRKVLQVLNDKYYKSRNPKSKFEKYDNDILFFAEYDNLLDFNNNFQYLKNKSIAEKVKYSLHYPDKRRYNLICYTVMPNHVHLVFYLLEEKLMSQTGLSAILPDVPQTILSMEKKSTITTLMKSIKGISAREANKILNRKGSFWQAESYDHIERDEVELKRIIKYVIYNPVKAGLVDKWEDWEHTYLAEDWW